MLSELHLAIDTPGLAQEHDLGEHNSQESEYGPEVLHAEPDASAKGKSYSAVK